MKLTTWIFPEHGGTIPGIPGNFPGGTKVVIDEDTNSIYSISGLYVSETSAEMKLPEGEQEIVTPGYKSKKKAENTDS